MKKLNEKILKKYLCCPKCKKDIILESNKLVCTSCKTDYSVKQNIPVMVDLKNLPPSHLYQIDYFENSDITKDDKYKLYPWQKEYVRRLIDNFGDVKNKVVLDCGSGSGYISIELAKKGAFVISTDLTLKSVVRLRNIANKKNLSNILFLCSTAEDLPIKSATVDYYISNAVLEHVPRETDAIKEAKRVTKKKAGVMVTVPLKLRYLNPFLIPVNLIHDKRIGHLRRYDEQSLKSRFKGWKLLNTYYTGHTSKVVKTLTNMVYPYFDEVQIEREDKKKNDKRFGASNIITFFERA